MAQRRTEGLFRQMDRHLVTNTYLTGEEFSFADLMSEFALVRMPGFGGRLKQPQAPTPWPA
jgi:glutathione S-transferase